VPAEVGEAEVVITLGDRRWRARGLERWTSYDQLRVNLLVALSGGDAFHVDTLDLYAHRQRQAFLKQAAAELKVDGELLKQDLGRVLFKLEQLLDERMKATLAPKERPAVTLSEEERGRALELLEDPQLLDRIRADFHAFGVVGEETNTLTGYLVAVSRKLARPLALLLQSSSAAGKSELMGAILAFTPPEERVAYSAMTGQSLFYMGETDLKHKVLAIAEEEGAERASYALKLLQSEGKLSIASAGKDPATGRHVTHCYHVEGPAAIMLTTTSVDLDEELQSRCVVLGVDEGREQTRAIHRLQRERRTLEGLLASRKRERILKLHHDAQRLLKPIPVVVPHVRRLTFLDTKTRTRRDHDKYLTLVETVALLHQHQRPLQRATTEDGEEVEYLEATLEDVAVASGLATEVLGRTLDELPPQSRRFLEQLLEMVSALCREKGIEQPDCLLGRRQILDETGWSLRQVRRHLDRLVELEYVLPHRAGNGQGLVYELLWDGKGRHGEPFVIGLADLERLRSTEPTVTAAPPSEATLAPPQPPACSPVAPTSPPAAIPTKPSPTRRLQPSSSPLVETSRLRVTQQTALHVASGGGRAAPSLAAAAQAAEER
jgi:DNA primase